MTEELLQRLGVEYETSGDRSTEHYRYDALLWYLQMHRPLSASQSDALYELGASDPDISMGGSIMVDIIQLPECPASVSAKALASGRKHLVVNVKRLDLLRELQHDFPSPELFKRCIDNGDGVVHRALLESIQISQEQLQELAEHGANRAVRNMASQRVRHSRKTS